MLFKKINSFFRYW